MTRACPPSLEVQPHCFAALRRARPIHATRLSAIGLIAALLAAPEQSWHHYGIMRLLHNRALRVLGK
jgi:hypothetical protein